MDVLLIVLTISRSHRRVASGSIANFAIDCAVLVPRPKPKKLEDETVFPLKPGLKRLTLHYTVRAVLKQIKTVPYYNLRT